MKKILFLLLSVFLVSCATQKTSSVRHVPSESILLGYDFRPYTEKGFLITPEMYQGNYDAIGLLDYILLPEARRTLKVVGAYRDENGRVVQEKQFSWDVESIDVAVAIDSMYMECVKMGADALVNFSVTTEGKSYTDYDPSLYMTGYRISGFAIKRK